MTNVPSFSRNDAAGSTTSASRAVSDRKISWHDDELAGLDGGPHVLRVRVGLGDVLAHHVERAHPPVEGGVEHIGNPQPGPRGGSTPQTAPTGGVPSASVTCW